jgi:hypothetical protein
MYKGATGEWLGQLHEIIFEADRPAGKTFEVALIICSVVMVIFILIIIFAISLSFILQRGLKQGLTS